MILNAIASMDETPFYLNMLPCPTAQKIGSKKVNIRTHWQKNWRVTAILNVLASSEKLPPLLIFKAMEGKDTEKNFLKINKCGEQESVRMLTAKCMQQSEHNFQMDIWGLQKIFVFLS